MRRELPAIERVHEGAPAPLQQRCRIRHPVDQVVEAVLTLVAEAAQLDSRSHLTHPLEDGERLDVIGEGEENVGPQ
jgi:hypothetical protein